MRPLRYRSKISHGNVTSFPYIPSQLHDVVDLGSIDRSLQEYKEYDNENINGFRYDRVTC